MIFFHGKVVHENDTLIEISCSTTSGMSGYPIISKVNYLGIYVGGPALPDKRELMLIISKVHEEKYGEVNRLIDGLTDYDHLYDLPVFSAFIHKFQLHIVYTLGKVEMGIALNYLEESVLNWFNSTTYIRNEEIKNFVNLSFELMYELYGLTKKRCLLCEHRDQ